MPSSSPLLIISLLPFFFPASLRWRKMKRWENPPPTSPTLGAWWRWVLGSPLLRSFLLISFCGRSSYTHPRCSSLKCAAYDINEIDESVDAFYGSDRLIGFPIAGDQGERIRKFDQPSLHCPWVTLPADTLLNKLSPPDLMPSHPLGSWSRHIKHKPVMGLV